ncbi:MAG TPA: SDR family NAD(P)-dependent oxidoreductase [Terriglobales bacterium]|nr:SDR family NAD(P)-dependent oxidoreductase [Terriglobales bacterium]
MPGRVQDRVAIVTGAAKGMGREICLTLADEGAHVMLAARDEAPLKELAAEIETRGRRAAVQSTDVTDEGAVKALVARTLAAFGGRIDILVNCAGVTGPVETPVWEIPTEAWDQVLGANVKGTFLPIKHVLPVMIAQRYGKVVNISGTSGLRGYKNRAAYSSSKWAIRGLTRTTALDAGVYNVNVNAVHPGIVDGPRMQRLCREKAAKRGWTPEQVYEEYVQEMALRRATSAQDIANTVCFLASDESKNITGQSITVDGGWDV